MKRKKIELALQGICTLLGLVYLRTCCFSFATWAARCSFDQDQISRGLAIYQNNSSSSNNSSSNNSSNRSSIANHSSEERPSYFVRLSPKILSKEAQLPIIHGFDNRLRYNPKVSLTLNSKGPSKRAKPSFVYHMHVPKTGGRTLMLQFGLWLNGRKVPNCLVDPCCTSWANYMEKAKASFSSNYTSVCKIISREIPLPGILATKDLLERELVNERDEMIAKERRLNAITEGWWFMVSLYRNPVSRFVSAARHNMRAGRCDTWDLGTAVDAKLRGKCKPNDHDREQAQYYYKQNKQNYSSSSTQSLAYEIQMINPFVPNPNASIAPGESPWIDYVSKFDFIGIPEYMDATNCILALQLSRLQYMDSAFALQNACQKNGRLRLENSLPGEPDHVPLTTEQVLHILSSRYPVDAQIYPQVLQSFQGKLARVLINHPDLSIRFQSNLTAVTEELRVWRKVAGWLREHQSTLQRGLLFQRLNELLLSEKDIIAPGLRWDR